ncbi:MAG: DoxX-like family protein [Anaerolineae bacterium]|nr:DoxX-like family protein [Anaerolineae bacterium]
MNTNLYIETFICADPRIMDDLWAKTQTPDQHERWDLRFSQIAYLPKLGPKHPQRFTYATRLGFGLKICGEGETVGECSRPNGERSSSLRFWSSDPKSLIREGSGYWRYCPQADGVRFITGYNYEARWGRAGQYVDRFIFRPIMRWATAWSFDRLRLWLERDLAPETSLRAACVHAIARSTVALTWLYHGLVPKLLFPHADEIRMFTDAGLSLAQAQQIVPLMGGAEVVMGIAMLWFWRQNWLFGLTIFIMLMTLASVVVTSPQLLGAAFNPVSLNIGITALSIIGWLMSADAPSATHCKYQ